MGARIAAATPSSTRCSLARVLVFGACGASALVPTSGPSRARRGAALFGGPVSGPGINPARNVVGGELECCCAEVRDTGVGTGFFRDGHCSTGPSDEGSHTVCVVATEAFLRFSEAAGNPLATPFPEYMFPGLEPGDRWCLCARRWAQARDAGFAPRVYLRATHEKTLDVVALDELKTYALDLAEVEADLARVDGMREAMMRAAGLAADAPGAPSEAA